jgi:hypothetical protein
VKNEPKKAIGGHFEFPISAELLPYGMSLHLAIFSPINNRTYFVATMVIKRQNFHFFIEKVR